VYAMAISILNLAITCEGHCALGRQGTGRRDARRGQGTASTKAYTGTISPVTCGARKGQRRWAVSGGAGGQEPVAV
jgi:hypothetical protein